MARLRQQHPRNYGSSDNISDEFESFVRYINASEYGNKTVSELLGQIFDGNGNFSGPLELRFDGERGLEYRVGAYDSYGCPLSDDGWRNIAPASELRGIPGISYGNILQPALSTRGNVVATSGQTDFSIFLEADDDVIVYQNGLLLIEGAGNDYTLNTAVAPTGVTLNVGATDGDEMTFFRVMTDLEAYYARTDYLLSADQSVFSFEHNSSHNLQVYKNGILQTEGAGRDYISDTDAGLVSFTSACTSGDTVSIMRVSDSTQARAAGLMLEASYVDSATGKILGNQIQFEDDGIPQAKVYGLSDLASLAATAVSSATEPEEHSLFWIDSSQTPARVMFWNGTSYLPVSGDIDIPAYGSGDARRFLMVNGTGTGLVYSSPDLSGLIPTTQKGAANGIATLDSDGRLTQTQLPSPRNRRCIWTKVSGTLSNTTYLVDRVFLQRVQIVGFFGRLDAGTCTAQVVLNTNPVGSTFSLGIPQNETALGSPINVDAASASIAIGIQITDTSSASDLDVGLVVETLDY